MVQSCVEDEQKLEKVYKLALRFRAFWGASIGNLNIYLYTH